MKHLKSFALICLAAAMTAACGEDEKIVDSYITADVTSVTGIDAADPSAVAVMIQTNTQWVVLDVPSWVSVSPTYGNGDAVLTVTPQSNYKNENTQTSARSGSFRVAGTANSASHNTGMSITISLSQNGFTPEVDPDASIGGITNLSELLAFVEAVNSASSLDRWKNAEGEIELLADIDVSSVSSWTPIGNTTATNAGKIPDDGNAFNVNFNGGGHTIVGLTISETNPTTLAGNGFFGVITDCTVKNLNVEVANLYAEAPDVSVVMGGIAGAAVNATIENCTVEVAGSGAIAMKVTGTSNNKPNYIGGVVGLIYASTVTGCTNNVPVRVYNETNDQNGGYGIHVGGIIGFGNSECTVKSCTNNGMIGGLIDGVKWGSAGRMAGIIGSCNNLATIEDCINNGNVHNTMTVTTDLSSRTAGITAFLNTKDSAVKNCVNNGDICFVMPDTETDTYAGYVSGFVGQWQNVVTITTCENYGAILSDRCNMTKLGSVEYEFGGAGEANHPEVGIVCGRPNSKAAVVTKCLIGGKIGPYNDASKVVTLSSSNYSNYMFGDTYARRKAAEQASSDNSFATK